MIRFISFEGGDGSGKTTQVKALEQHLKDRGWPCLITREPGGTPLGQLIRRVLLEAGKQPVARPTELFLYLADRAQHVQEVILPSLTAGQIVLCDRYTDSTLAYQGYGRGIDLELLRRLNELANRGVQPDLTFLLDCPVELGLARTAQRQLNAPAGGNREDRFEREALEFHERVRAGFLQLARAEPNRFRVIDAVRPAGDISADIQRMVDERLA
ncbi:MAG TPA: dTMP kinase [Candidatus Binatia bacterium]|nr:dTMP kinase [Candidatus Binatia bacterium]